MKISRKGYGWAWEFQAPNGTWLLCNWCEPFKASLALKEQPAEGARMVHVELVPTSKRNRKRYGYKP
jgi:hypothetical protein